MFVRRLTPVNISSGQSTLASGELLWVSTAIRRGNSQHYVVTTSGQMNIAWIIWLLVRYVMVWIIRSAIPFWWCALALQKSMVWPTATTLSLDYFVLKHRCPSGSAWCWLSWSCPTIARARCLESTVSCAPFLSWKVIYVNFEHWSTKTHAMLYLSLRILTLDTGIIPPTGECIMSTEMMSPGHSDDSITYWCVVADVDGEVFFCLPNW